MDLILYHKGCPDGWCSAYIAKKRYPEAELLAWDQGTEPPYPHIKDREVLSVDLRWKNRESVEKAQSVAKLFTVFDHHASGDGDMDGLPNFVFDVTRSGAGITWDELFRPIVIKAKNALSPFVFVNQRPWWVDYVQDRDLWTWKLPNSKEISAYINSYPQTIESWDILTSDENAGKKNIIEAGAALLRQEAAYVTAAGQYAAYGVFAGYPAYIANANYFIASELGAVLNKLKHGVHLGITWYERETDGEIYFSLRGDGEVNCGELAKQFPGGGGHHNAAGFHVSTARGRIIIDNVLSAGQEIVCAC